MLAINSARVEVTYSDLRHYQISIIRTSPCSNLNLPSCCERSEWNPIIRDAGKGFANVFWRTYHICQVVDLR